MTNVDLSNIIFPDAKNISYYEEKYPLRNLSKNAEVTRIGPSPTGNVHIGTIYQALINKTVARQTKGLFYTRIEDTDQKREIQGGIAQIIEFLKIFDLIPDEGMYSATESTGDYGPYKQSERKDIYEACAKHLISLGKAYPCFCTPEEGELLRAEQEAKGDRPGYYNNWAKCRCLSMEEAKMRIKKGVKYIIRFKSFGKEGGKIEYKDVIKGNMEFPENDNDIVIIKADGLPTYHFAHAVDDHFMKTTLVIRGDEWLPSLPLHLQLFQALGFRAPKYAHTASLLKNDNGNKRKISKRKDPEATISYYLQEGFPIIATKEYLMNIANSNFENWRNENLNLNMENFNFQLNKINISGALLDMKKLINISKNVISEMTAEELYEKIYAWATEYDNSLLTIIKDKEYTIKVLGIERGGKNNRKDISKWSDIKDNILYMYDEYFLGQQQIYPYQIIHQQEDVEKILKLYIEKYYDENDDKETWFNKIRELTQELGYAKEVKQLKNNPKIYKAHVGDVSTVLRVALTGRSNTPDMYELIHILGKKSIIRRFEKAISTLSN
jgi:glutamyl-tRNA synthetase